MIGQEQAVLHDDHPGDLGVLDRKEPVTDIWFKQRVKKPQVFRRHHEHTAAEESANSDARSPWMDDPLEGERPAAAAATRLCDA